MKGISKEHSPSREKMTGMPEFLAKTSCFSEHKTLAAPHPPSSLLPS